MQIVFICGSLQQGKDGVGDYVRRLSAELLRQNHQVNIIAIHDRHLQETVRAETQPDQEQWISVLRLSSQLSWKERLTKASEHVNTINPDCISLQYVPFSFHDKGLSIKLAGILKKITADRAVHIMFHELWLGLSKQSSRRHIIWGMLQRQLISLLVRVCRNPVIHTHTPLYQSELNGLNIQSSLLPLFSNIPVTGDQKHFRVLNQVSNKQIRFVFFGGIFPDVPIAQFTAEVAAYARKKQKLVDLTLIGRSGAEQAVWASAWRAHGLPVRVLGEQSPEQISHVLNESSIGLSTTPVMLSGKSGAIAAMHAHGLPVICITAPWHPRHSHPLLSKPGVTTYSVGYLEEVIDNQSSISITYIPIEEIATKFAISLS